MSNSKTGAKPVPTEKGDEKSLNLTVEQIEKRFGQGAIMRLGKEHTIVPVDTIPTGTPISSSIRLM